MEENNEELPKSNKTQNELLKRYDNFIDSELGSAIQDYLVKKINSKVNEDSEDSEPYYLSIMELLEMDINELKIPQELLNKIVQEIITQQAHDRNIALRYKQDIEDERKFEFYKFWITKSVEAIASISLAILVYNIASQAIKHNQPYVAIAICCFPILPLTYIWVQSRLNKKNKERIQR